MPFRDHSLVRIQPQKLGQAAPGQTRGLGFGPTGKIADLWCVSGHGDRVPDGAGPRSRHTAAVRYTARQRVFWGTTRDGTTYRQGPGASGNPRMPILELESQEATRDPDPGVRLLGYLPKSECPRRLVAECLPRDRNSSSPHAMHEKTLV